MGIWLAGWLALFLCDRRDCRAVFKVQKADGVDIIDDINVYSGACINTIQSILWGPRTTWGGI